MKNTNKVIWATALIQIALTTLLVMTQEIDKQLQSRSVLIGSSVSLLNFVLLVLLWGLIFSRGKKSVAMAVLLIVIKYSILIWVFVQLPKLLNLNLLGFAAGLLINPVAVIVAGLNYRLITKTSVFRNKSK